MIRECILSWLSVLIVIVCWDSPFGYSRNAVRVAVATPRRPHSTAKILATYIGVLANS
jgi:hypothetical protein